MDSIKNLKAIKMINSCILKYYYRQKNKTLYEQLCDEIQVSGDFSKIFSKGNERGSRYYTSHCHNIINTYLFFFDETGHMIRSNWRPFRQQITPCFPGNSSFEISSAVHTGFKESIQHIIDFTGNDINKYFIACPTYTTSTDFKEKQFIDCQPVITGKCFKNTSIVLSCMEEMAGEVGLVPKNHDSTKLFKSSLAKNTTIFNKKGNVFSFTINISDCEPYDGSVIVPADVKSKEIYSQRVQVLIYGTLDDFLKCIPEIKQRAISNDFYGIGAIRLIPVLSIPIIYSMHMK